MSGKFNSIGWQYEQAHRLAMSIPNLQSFCIDRATYRKDANRYDVFLHEKGEIYAPHPIRLCINASGPDPLAAVQAAKFGWDQALLLREGEAQK
jgi:hypothetical protein